MMPPMAIPIPMVLVSDDESGGDIDDWLFESIGTPSRTTPPMLPLPNTPAKLPLPHHDVARIADDEIEDFITDMLKEMEDKINDSDDESDDDEDESPEGNDQ